MSDAVDVTLFDARPKALSQAKRGTDPVTGETSYKPAEYLPMDFDRPALMIAENLAGERRSSCGKGIYGVMQQTRTDSSGTSESAAGSNRDCIDVHGTGCAPGSS